MIEQKYLLSSQVYNQDDCMKRMEEMLQDVVNKKGVDAT